MSRLIWFAFNNNDRKTWDEMRDDCYEYVVHFIDNNGLNCNSENLQYISRKELNTNIKKHLSVKSVKIITPKVYKPKPVPK